MVWYISQLFKVFCLKRKEKIQESISVFVSLPMGIDSMFV